MLRQCLDQCQTNYDVDLAQLTCESYCNAQERTAMGVRYLYAYNLWWATALVENQVGLPDETFISPVILGRPDRIEHQSGENFMDQSVSFCIDYEVLVLYDNGLCCHYVGNICQQKG